MPLQMVTEKEEFRMKNGLKFKIAGVEIGWVKMKSNEYPLFKL